MDEEYPDRVLYLTSPEDVVLNKLIWFRMGGVVSDRQWLDALGVLKVQKGRLDIGYMKRWAKLLEVTDLLAKAFLQVDTANK